MKHNLFKPDPRPWRGWRRVTATSADLNDFILGRAFNLVTAVIAAVHLLPEDAEAELRAHVRLQPNHLLRHGPARERELSVGVGFGLFAIFSVIRYRTRRRCRSGR
ncbi:MAG: DUF4956 domain-containing protein [Dehalococcoidia bacterium]